MARIDQVLSGEKSWGKYALDVLGHAGLGTAYALPVAALAVFFSWGAAVAIVGGSIVALIGGAIREVIQYKKSGKLHLLDRVLDALHHVLGGPIAFGIMLLVRLAF